MQNLTRACDPGAPSLKEAFAGRLKIGAAINSWDLDPASPACSAILRQFNILTLENESKPVMVQPEEGKFVFDKADRFVDFGGKHGVTLRGHTLVWHGQCPMWFFLRDGEQNAARGGGRWSDLPDGALASKDELLERMRTHIHTLVGRYKGRVDRWDVVNEVLTDDGGMRNSLWYRIAGEDFIAEAFRAAHEADPAARLVINDYNLESHDKKADAMVSLVKRLLEKGVPVGGIGMQMHLGPATDLEKLKANAEKLASLRELCPDLKLEATELDVSAFRFEDPSETLDWTDEREGAFRAFYTELFRFYLELADEGKLDAVIFWGLHDGVSWLNGFPRRRRNVPLLIGRDLVLKPAFYDVIGTAAKREDIK